MLRGLWNLIRKLIVGIFSDIISTILGIIGTVSCILCFCCIIPAIGDSTYLIAAVILGAIGLISHLINFKSLAKAVMKCNSCKNTMRGATYRYQYDLSKVKNDSLPVDVYIICPHCGHANHRVEQISYKLGDSTYHIEYEVEDLMKRYNKSAK